MNRSKVKRDKKFRHRTIRPSPSPPALHRSRAKGGHDLDDLDLAAVGQPLPLPFGALQLIFYELACLLVAPALGDTFVAHLLEGGLAGGMTAIVTTPVDCSITRLMLVDASGASDMRGVDNIVDAAGAVWSEQGPIGFTKGWLTRAAQFGPAAMVFFSAFETLYYVIERL